MRTALALFRGLRCNPRFKLLERLRKLHAHPRLIPRRLQRMNPQWCRPASQS